MHRSCWCNHENILKHQILRGWNETIFLLKCIITHIVIIIIYLYLYGCFLKWWYPPNTPKWSFLVRKPMVVWYHHFRNPPYYLLLWVASFKPGPHRSGMVSSWRHVEHQDLPLQRRRIADWRFEVCVLKKIPVVFFCFDVFCFTFFHRRFRFLDDSWPVLLWIFTSPRSAVWPVRALTFSANGHWLVGGCWAKFAEILWLRSAPVSQHVSRHPRRWRRQCQSVANQLWSAWSLCGHLRRLERPPGTWWMEDSNSPANVWCCITWMGALNS